MAKPDDRRSRGFPAVVAPGCRLLVLGTLPGPESLRLRQYYAQPRNAFWRIMGELVGAGPELPYPQRLEALLSRGIALWDVCHSAHRPGALDADIHLGSVRPNDIAGLFRTYPGIRQVFFNGKTAERLYARFVLTTLDDGQRAITSVALPSTSPAYAAMRFEEKCARWKRAILRGMHRGSDE